MDKKNEHKTRKKASLSDDGNRKDCKSKERATYNSEWNNPHKRIYLPCHHYITLVQANKQAMERLFTTIICSQCRTEYPISILESEAETDSLEGVKSSEKKKENDKYPEVSRIGDEQNSNVSKKGNHKGNQSGNYFYQKGPSVSKFGKIGYHEGNESYNSFHPKRPSIPKWDKKGYEGNQSYNSFHQRGQSVPKCNENSENINPSVQDKNQVSNIENDHVLCKGNGKSSVKNLNNKIPPSDLIPFQSDRPIRKNSSEASFHQPQKKRPSQWNQRNENVIKTPHIKNKNNAVNIETTCARSIHKNNGDSLNKNCNDKTSSVTFPYDTNGSKTRKNSSDVSSLPLSLASKDQLQDPQRTTEIVVEENNSSKRIAFNNESYNRDQGNSFKKPSKNQQSDYSESKGEPIVNEPKKVSPNKGCENNSCHNCRNLNNISEHYLSEGFRAHNTEDLETQMGCEESLLSSLKQTVNQLRHDENHDKYAFRDECRSSSQMDATNFSMHTDVLQSEMCVVENAKATIRKLTENDTVFSNSSEAKPIPAPRHFRSDGKTLVDNYSSTLILFSPSKNNGDSHSAFSEKGAILKTTDPSLIYNNGKEASSFEYKNDKLAYELGMHMCIDCTKSIPQKICKDHENKGHTVMNLEDGIDNLMNKEFKTIQSMQSDMQNKFLEIHWHDITLDASIDILPEIFNSFKERQMHSDSQKEKGNQILYQIQEISGKGISTKSRTTFLEYENLKHSVQKTKIQAETWHKEVNHIIPFWLISSWLKYSVAVVLSGAVSHGKDIFVVKGNKGEEMAKLSFLGNRLFLSPFCRNVTTKDDDFFIKHELVEPIFSNEVSLAFMKISCANEESSKPIIIRVNIATFFGKQFIMMCTSESGNSYLGTKFFRNNWIGKEGHHIWGGDYSNNDGSGGSVVLLDKDVSVEISPLPLVEGMIAARYGYNDRSTIFRIYMQGSKSGFTESCAFAQIEEGIDILQCASMMGDITKVTVVDVGIVAQLI